MIQNLIFLLKMLFPAYNLYSYYHNFFFSISGFLAEILKTNKTYQ